MSKTNWIKLRNPDLAGERHSIGNMVYQVDGKGDITVPEALAWLGDTGWELIGEAERPPEGSFWPVDSGRIIPSNLEQAYTLVAGMGLSADDLRALAKRMDEETEAARKKIEIGPDSPIDLLLRTAGRLGVKVTEKMGQKALYAAIKKHQDEATKKKG